MPELRRPVQANQAEAVPLVAQLVSAGWLLEIRGVDSVSDLVAFLNARLSADEAAARDAHYEGQRWITEEEGVYRYPVFSDPVNPAYADQELVQMADRKRDARHIARHDPARVLREVEAKRKILAAYLASDDDLIDIALGDALIALAAVYRDHPDYDQAARRVVSPKL